MEIRHITPKYAVSPQIDPADVAEIAAAGFTAIVLFALWADYPLYPQ